MTTNFFVGKMHIITYLLQTGQKAILLYIHINLPQHLLDTNYNKEIHNYFPISFIRNADMRYFSITYYLHPNASTNTGNLPLL